ncbi:GNAT family N-acetyltransferase [Oceanivirga salmonicida]|uniref:GNAT family N-acetyltransferase n=1 Tax=Oceanivirga salmonicida TaxID=1769291 RepID=UPI0012E3155E|nr:N-acetyltransferase [Oceanivirga salmonicida]
MNEIMKKLNAKEDKKILERIYLYEEEVFGNAAVGQYNISPFTKYGSCYAIYNEKDIICVIEVLFSLNNKAYIYGLSTNKDYRHKGYATKLMNFCIDDIKKYNINSIELTVAPENEIAIKFYNKFKFTIDEYLENEYFDNDDRLLMKKEI